MQAWTFALLLQEMPNFSAGRERAMLYRFTAKAVGGVQ
jgi:hypothetical protein